MAFEDKKGIVVASPFKLQAEALLDVRQQVDTIAERDRLVTLKAATAGLRVFVKENSTSYVYTGSKWDPLATGAPYKHPTGDGNHHVPATGTTNAGKYLKAGATAGSEAWSKIAASDITGLPTRLPNPQTLTIRSNDTNTSVDYTGAEAKTLTMSPEWVYGASDAPLSKIAEYSEKGTRYVKVLDIESNKDNLYGRVQQQFLIMGLNFSFILNLCAHQSNSKIFNRYSASYITTSADGVDDSRFLLGVKNINSESNKIELWYKQDQWTSALAVLPKGRSGETTRVFNLYSVNNTDHPVTTAPVFDISIPIKNNYKIYTTTGQATDGSMTQKAITDALNSKASSSHTHTAGQITGLPTKLPNPQPLKFTGAATATYDGSGAVTINIPTAQASPHALTVQLNGGTTEGTNKFTFNGGAAKNINITPASIGAALASHTHPGYAPTSHTHTAGQITGLPTSLKNPYALTIKTNGAAAATYDGSAVKEVNITPASIGAAASAHTHSEYLPKSHENKVAIDEDGQYGHVRISNTLTSGLVPTQPLFTFVPTLQLLNEVNDSLDSGIKKIIDGTTPVGKSKQLVDSVNNQGIGLTYDEISETGPFDRCKFAMFYNNSIIGGMTPNRVTDFIGAAKSNHTHTPASIGAAPSSHTHNYAGSSSAGGPANSAKKVDFPVGTVLWTTSSSATFFSSTCGGTWEVVGNIDTIINSSTTLTLYMHKKKAL